MTEEPNRSPRSLAALVVEDVPAHAELVRLELEGTFDRVEILVVDTSHAYSAALAARPWHLIIADHRLPQFSSTEALNILKESGRDIPFIIVSGAMGEEQVVAAMKAGASDFVTKEKLGRLGPAVERALREAEVRRRLAASEREARAALDHQAMLLENLHDAVIGVDAGLIITAWNRAAHRLLGWSREEAIGRNFWELVPTEAAEGSPPLAETKEQLARLGRGELPLRRRTRSGEWVDVEATIVALRGPDGADLGFISLNRDVSLRNRAEAALRASEARLRGILDAVNEGVWVTDAQGRTEFMNRRAAELFGLSAEETVGKSFVDVVPPEIRDAAREDLESVKRGERGGHDLRIRRGDGSETILLLSRAPLPLPGGRAAGAVALFMDVTASRRAQEQLLQGQKLEAVGRLASGVAHDFNNLLVVIQTCAGFLLEALPDGDERRADAKEIRDTCDRAAQLVRQLLTFGRRGPAHAIPQDVNPVVQGVVKLLTRVIGEDVTVSASIAPEPCATLVDPGQLEQVLMNLALNARDAMPEGGKLRIETRNALLEVAPPGCEGLPAGPYAVLVVEDTGCGMSADVVSKIFEPFFTTKAHGKGTGLGLATAYGIVEQAGGRIAVASQPGRGATFTVYLPASGAGAVAFAAPPEPRSLPPPASKVLVVDDDEAVRRLTRRILERRGFSVVEAQSSALALQLLGERGRIDVVLSDVVMPEVSGADLAVVVGKLRPEVPVVLMSGYSGVPGAAGARILPKPFTEDALVARLHEALAGALSPAAPRGPAT